MRSSTVALALSLLVTAVVSVSGTYTNGNDFLDDLPTCIKDCNADTIAALRKKCDSASNNLECVCDASDSMTSSTSDAACTLGCSEEDQNTLIKVGLDMASSCVPYLTDNTNNSTSSMMSSMTSTSSSMMASSTGGSRSSSSSSSRSMATTTTTTGTGTTPSSTASNSPAQTGAAAAGRAAWVGSLLVAVVPAALLAGMVI